jgi:hypothetical protein
MEQDEMLRVVFGAWITTWSGRLTLKDFGKAKLVNTVTNNKQKPIENDFKAAEFAHKVDVTLWNKDVEVAGWGKELFQQFSADKTMTWNEVAEWMVGSQF